MRASLPQLKYAKLNQLYGGFDGPYEDLEYLDRYGEVDKFLFAHGENPFTSKALEKHEANVEAEREVVSYELGRLEAYDRYH